jgi:two-component system, LuxR family, sensor kinase FixL
MAFDTDDPRTGPVTTDALLFLNRATLVAHTVRTAIHEVNNVLQMISGSTEMLGSNPSMPPEAAKRLDAILRQTARGHAILQAVGELARREASDERLVDVGTAAEQVLEMRRYEHNRAGLVASLNRQSGHARIDPQHLKQMLLNLVLNAEQAVAGLPRGTISVEVSQAEQVIEVRVSDNGSGLRSDQDPFAAFRTTRGPAAPGLGLTATRLLAERYGGTIEVVDRTPGTASVLRLPAAPAAG